MFRSAAAMPAIERRSGLVAVASPRTVRGEQLDLDRVHRVDVRVAELDRPLDDRVAVEQLARLDDREHRRHRPPVLRLDQRPRGGRGRRSPERGRGSRGRSRSRTSQASSRGSRRRRGRTATRGRACAGRRGHRRRPPSRTRSRSRTRRGGGSGSASTRTPRGSRGAQRARLAPPSRGAMPGASRSRGARARPPA